jgi:signal transduction histidine kinase
MAHRPPLKGRFWLYCAVAYLIPVMTQVGIPNDPGRYDELVWLITLAPAFLLSLHYGLKGAVAGLLMGTTLFLVVQVVVAMNYTPDDWRITVPTYIAYGAVSVSVGWLSEQLHEFYERALASERLAAIGQVALTIRHELSNALTAIVAESEFLADAKGGLSEEHRRAASAIKQAGLGIAQDLRKLTNLADAPTTNYAGGVNMVDLRAARSRK